MAAWESIDRALALLGLRYGPPSLGQTVGGTHVAGSEHYAGRARDYGTSDSDAGAIAQALVPYATGPDAVVDELFFSPAGIFYDKGQAFTPSAELRQGHYSHVHVGVRPGGDLAAAVSGGVSSPAGRARRPDTKLVETGISGGGEWGGVFDLARRAAFTVAFVGAGLAMVGVGIHRTVGNKRPLKGAMA